MISRAMGRVIGHELAHAIVPERDHDGGGLLSANLKRSHLKKSSLRFLDATAKAFAEALAAFEDRLAASQMATNQPALN